MRLEAVLLAWLCLSVSAMAQCGSVDLVVRAIDIGQDPVPGVQDVLTPTGNLRRNCGTNVVVISQKSRSSDANGVAIFTNTMWGAYDLDIPTPNGTTELKLWIPTNYSGRWSAATFLTNSSAMPPNPTASYYTAGQVDAITEQLILTGGPTSGIPQLNGTGTGTTLINPTVTGGNVATTNMIAASLTGVVTQYQAIAFHIGSTSAPVALSATGDQGLSVSNLTGPGTVYAGLFSASGSEGSGFAGSGAQLLYLPADQLLSGTVPLARLSGITSNQLDGPTKAQLALAGTGGGGGTNYTAGNGIVITGNTIALYSAPTISGFINNQNTVEIGSTVSSTVLTWTLAGGAITGQSMNQGIGAMNTSLRATNDTASYSTGRTYTLTVTDGVTTNAASTSVAFEHRSYWGTSANSAYTTLASLGNSGFTAAAAKTGMSFSPNNEYSYYAYPLSFGSVSFNVGGFNVNDWTAVTNHFTNQSGNTSDYLVWRSSAPIYGTGIIVNAY